MAKLTVEIIDKNEVRLIRPDNYEKVREELAHIVDPEFYISTRYTQPEPKTRAFSQAIAKIKKMLIKYPDNLSVYYYLGLLYQAVEEIDIAIGLTTLPASLQNAINQGKIKFIQNSILKDTTHSAL